MGDEYYIDKIKGMFAGFFVGDALGAIYERHPKPPYINIINQPAVSFSRFKGKVKTSIGQITDDSEMTLIILRRLIKDKGYNKDKILKDYMEWANSPGSKFLGKNTRNLFLGVKTLRGYESRRKKFITDVKEEKWSQSNGALMRCSSLFIFPTVPKKPKPYFIIDSSLTNPHLINIDSNRVYIKTLQYLFVDTPIDEIFKKILDIAETKEVKKIILDVNKNKIRDIQGKNKGWVLNALYISLYALKYKSDNIMDMYDYVIGKHIQGDTDTNGAIAGALIGMKLGLKKMNEEKIFKENITTVINSDTSTGDYKRDVKYSPRDYEKLSEKLWELFKSKCDEIDKEKESLID